MLSKDIGAIYTLYFEKHQIIDDWSQQLFGADTICKDQIGLIILPRFSNTRIFRSIITVRFTHIYLCSQSKTDRECRGNLVLEKYTVRVLDEIQRDYRNCNPKFINALDGLSTFKNTRPRKWNHFMWMSLINKYIRELSQNYNIH